MSFRYASGYDPRTIDGNKAVTTQPFTELNSKRGVQYEAAFYLAALPTGESVDIIFSIGSSNPVLIKSVVVQFESDEISTQLFVGPSYTGGAEIPVYNLNDAGAVVDDVVVVSGATVSDTGLAVGPEIRTLGAAPGFLTQGLINVGMAAGVERVLAANADYLYRITNTDGATTRIAGIATWYQGPLSVDE